MGGGYPFGGGGTNTGVSPLPPQTALAFLGVSGLVHHALGLDAVFVDPGGEWKLGGLERVAAASEGTPPRPPGDPPRPQDPPELSDPSRGQGEPW